ncbi:MAG: leucine-rich repeat domain-containing protein [Patescibacteria group bacterium]|nr:leucine-rich repeat domain-containing protein [Patescibacteria group bacterium]
MKFAILGIFVAGLLSLTGCTILGQQIQITPVQNTPANNGASTETTPTVNTNVKLDLSNQQLTKVPEYIFNMTSLEELDLSNNLLTGAIQSQIGQLKKLKVLNASNNMMTGVPAEVGQLQNLQVLDLSNNQLTGLPNELANLKNLKTFNISGNNYSTQDLNIIMKGLPASVNIIK